MIKIENIQVFNLEGAIRGMRFPLQSNDKSDSGMIHRASHFRFTVDDSGDMSVSYIPATSEFRVGEKDFDLMKRLVRAGNDHAKWTRQVLVSINITGPLYWWKEMDQYRIGVTTNSESTMHRLAKTPITVNCFSFDNIDDIFPLALDRFEDHIQDCELLRKQYLDTQDKRYWRALIQMLPSSWNQMRHWTGNYANLLNMGVSRQNHKLSEWRESSSTHSKENSPTTNSSSRC